MALCFAALNVDESLQECQLLEDDKGDDAEHSMSFDQTNQSNQKAEVEFSAQASVDKKRRGRPRNPSGSARCKTCSRQSRMKCPCGPGVCPRWPGLSTAPPTVPTAETQFLPAVTSWAEAVTAPQTPK